MPIPGPDGRRKAGEVLGQCGAAVLLEAGVSALAVALVVDEEEEEDYEGEREEQEEVVVVLDTAGEVVV